MTSQNIYTIEPETVEESRALDAFIKSLKLKFQISKKTESKNEILADLELAIKELNLVKKGKIKARDIQELLDEL